MKFYKIAIALFSAALVLPACETEKAIYVPDNKNVSFPSSIGNFQLDGNDLVIPIIRGVANEAASVEIKLEDKMGIYTIKTPTVQFASGEYTSEVRLSYDLSTLLPAIDYSFSLSFDEADMSVVGSNSFQASAMMPLEYEDCGTVSIGYCYVSSMLPDKTFNLKKAKYTTNYYMIEGLYGSDTDLEITVEGDHFILRTPAKSNKWYSIPLVEVASAANHPSYGQMTGWMDPDTEYCTITGAAEDNSLQVGSTIGFDIYWTVSAGYFGWKTEEIVVTEIK